MTTWQCLLCESTSAGTEVRRVNQHPLCSWCRAELKRTARGWCPRCTGVYALTEMSDGYCRPHKRAMTRAYYAANAERERARVKAWKARNPQTSQRLRKYVPNPTKDRARAKRWYAANRTRVAAHTRATRQAHAAANPAFWRERYQRERARLWRKTMQGELS